MTIKTTVGSHATPAPTALRACVTGWGAAPTKGSAFQRRTKLAWVRRRTFAAAKARPCRTIVIDAFPAPGPALVHPEPLQSGGKCRRRRSSTIRLEEVWRTGHGDPLGNDRCRTVSNLVARRHGNRGDSASPTRIVERRLLLRPDDNHCDDRGRNCSGAASNVDAPRHRCLRTTSVNSFTDGCASFVRAGRRMRDSSYESESSNCWNATSQRHW